VIPVTGGIVSLVAAFHAAELRDNNGERPEHAVPSAVRCALIEARIAPSL
jgi:hypothetical protein